MTAEEAEAAEAAEVAETADIIVLIAAVFQWLDSRSSNHLLKRAKAAA